MITSLYYLTLVSIASIETFNKNLCLIINKSTEDID